MPKREGKAARAPDGAEAAAPVFLPSLGYLRAFVVVMVVVHHAVLAYIPGLPAVSHVFLGGLRLWRAFPVIDREHWALAGPIMTFNDAYFMSLMFLLSGLFVCQSIERKGVAVFVRDRMMRLGIPFLFTALIISPAAYAFAWLQSGGALDLLRYASAWIGMGDWPTGPAWFVLALLVFDMAAAALIAAAPNATVWLGALVAAGKQKPVSLVLRVCALSLLVYAPLALIFGPDHWTDWGPVQFQTARILHYFLYFLVGVGLGANGLSRGLLATDGLLAKRWALWLVAMVVGWLIGAVVFFGLAGSPIRLYPFLLLFVVNCALRCFAFLALFTRFAKRRNPVCDSLTANSYGIYLVHYVFVAAIQYALLTAPLPGSAKAGMVVAGALATSWLVAMGLRRLPVAAKLLGE